MILMNECILQKAKIVKNYFKQKTFFQLFLINGVIKDVSDHSKTVFVDVFKGVLKRMPGFGETLVAAFRPQVDDVDGWDAGDLVHGKMVVADGVTQFVDEMLIIP